MPFAKAEVCCAGGMPQLDIILIFLFLFIPKRLRKSLKMKSVTAFFFLYATRSCKSLLLTVALFVGKEKRSLLFVMTIPLALPDNHRQGLGKLNPRTSAQVFLSGPSPPRASENLSEDSCQH